MKIPKNNLKKVLFFIFEIVFYILIINDQMHKVFNNNDQNTEKFQIF